MKSIPKQNVFTPALFALTPSATQADSQAVVALEPAVLLTQLVYTPRDVEVLLHLSKNTVNSLLNRGTLRGRRVGRKWLIPRAAIQEFLSQEEQG